MELPLISIIVPVYNAEKYIKRCIESILNQTYSNIELILINDGSEDGSLEIINDYERTDQRIIVVNQENSGVSEARNAGINMSRGEFIGFVDADDYIEPDMYERLYNTISEEAADIVCCGYEQKYKDFCYFIATESQKKLNGIEEILSRYLRQDIRSGIGDGNWNKLFKSCVINQIRYKRYANGEDIEFQYNVFKNAHKMVCIPDILYHYVMNENSATNSEFNVQKSSILKVSDDILDDIIKNYSDIKSEAYAFNLTWKLSLLQNIYSSKTSAEYEEVKAIILESLKTNYRFYINNSYSKRLDQFYLRAAVNGLMSPAMKFRTFVRSIVPSKDKRV